MVHVQRDAEQSWIRLTHVVPPRIRERGRSRLQLHVGCLLQHALPTGCCGCDKDKVFRVDRHSLFPPGRACQCLPNTDNATLERFRVGGMGAGGIGCPLACIVFSKRSSPREGGVARDDRHG